MCRIERIPALYYLMTESAASGLQSKDRPVAILVPGVFSYLHYGHFRFFQECKAAFRQVRLVVGIHDSPQTFLSTREKTQTVAQITAVDEVILHLPKVDRDLVEKYGIDYVAVWTEFEPQVLAVDAILCLPGYSAQGNTQKIAELVYASEEDFLMHILEDKLQAWECGMTRAQLHLHQVRLYIRRKLALWSDLQTEDMRRQPALRLLGKAAERLLKRLLTSDRPRNHP